MSDRALPGRLPPRRALRPVALRWPLVGATLALIGVLLWPVLERAPQPPRARATVDEILAFALDPAETVDLKLPPEHDRVVITSWSLAPPSADPEGHHPYGFRAALLDEAGIAIISRRFEIESRVSRPLVSAEFTARLADGDRAVTDSRTTLVVSPALRRGGRLRLEADPANIEPVLLRVSYRQARGELERRLSDTALDLGARRRLGEGRTALGLLDLPPAARAEALASWGRRLDADGQLGEDFHVARLLIGDLRTDHPARSGVPGGFVVGPRRLGAFNFAAPVRLEVLGPPGLELETREAGGEPRQWRIGGDGMLAVDLPATTPRTLLVGAVQRTEPLYFQLAASQALAQIGVLPVGSAEGDMLRIQPDVRLLRYYALDPSRPVETRIAPGQQLVGIYLRAELDDATELAEVTGRMWARWYRRGEGTDIPLAAELRRSEIDRWRAGGAATDAAAGMLAIPPGVDSLEIRGQPSLRVSIWTIDPLVGADVLELPYRIDLGPDRIWRHAPFDLRQRAVVRPSNHEELARAGRMRTLSAQVRIEPRGGRGAGEVPERVLEPEGTPIQQHLLEPAALARGAPLPDDGASWVDRPARLLVARDGPRAARLTLVFRADASRLGAEVALSIDGREQSRAPLGVLSGRLVLDLAPGAHQVALLGLGPGGLAYADAAPADGGPILRRRTVAELPADGELVLPIRQSLGEALWVVLQVVTETVGEPFDIGYSLDGGKPRRLAARFFRRATLPTGRIEGLGGDAGRGLLWEMEAAGAGEGRAPHGLGRAVVAVGDDLAAATHRLRLHNAGARRLWLRAVLVGQDALPSADEARMWVEQGR